MARNGSEERSSQIGKGGPRRVGILVSVLGLVVLATGLWSGCDSVDQVGGGLTRAEYAKRLKTLCRVDSRDEGRYLDRYDSAGERYESDPDYLFSEYSEDVATLDAERLGDYRRFVSRVAALEAPLTFGAGQEDYVQYLRRQVSLLRDVLTFSRRGRDAARIDEDDDSWNSAYDGAVEKLEASFSRGFLSDPSYVDFLIEKTGCIEEL